jgi:Kdo2-lipid IVA lauroyltransferase/acyltransferase
MRAASRPWHQTAYIVRRRIGHLVEAGLIWLCFAVLRLYSPQRASRIGGWVGRRLGPLLLPRPHMRAAIAAALPLCDAARLRCIHDGAWDNLGRVMAEYAHLDSLAATPDPFMTEIRGQEHLLALKIHGQPAIVMTGHLANWEICAYACTCNGMPLDYVFRPPNNPFIAGWLARWRAPLGGRPLAKGQQAARGLVKALREGRSVGLLVDQKLNEGISVPFFGRSAMTSPLAAELSLRYGVPILPMRAIRLQDMRFRLEILPPLWPPAQPLSAAERHIRTVETTLHINQILEGWIKETPEQWMWQHRRWPKSP